MPRRSGTFTLAPMPPRKATSDAALLELRAFGLAYPGAHTKSPWPGHCDLAVKNKTFAHMSIEGAPFSMSCKLPHSSAVALSLPFAEPTGYGLGKSGWVTAKFAPHEVPPVDLLKAWIDESYRAVAPKTLVKELDARGGTSAPSPKAATKAAKPPVKKRVSAPAPKRTSTPTKKSAKKTVPKRAVTSSSTTAKSSQENLKPGR